MGERGIRRNGLKDFVESVLVQWELSVEGEPGGGEGGGEMGRGDPRNEQRLWLGGMSHKRGRSVCY